MPERLQQNLPLSGGGTKTETNENGGANSCEGDGSIIAECSTAITENKSCVFENSDGKVTSWSVDADVGENVRK